MYCAFIVLYLLIQAITHEGVLGASEVSALAEAALGGHTDVVTLLLNNKADVYFKSGVS